MDRRTRDITPFLHQSLYKFLTSASIRFILLLSFIILYFDFSVQIYMKLHFILHTMFLYLSYDRHNPHSDGS